MDAWRPSDLRRSLDVPDGEVTVMIVEVEERKSTGDDGTRLAFEVVDEGKHKGLRVFEFFVAQKMAAYRRLFLLLRALGMDARDAVEPQELLGKVLRVQLEARDYQGLPQARIAKFLPLASAKTEDAGGTGSARKRPK